jgi:hypothetical protein
MKHLRQLSAFICTVPTTHKNRLSSREILSSQIKDADISLLGRDGVECRNWAQANELNVASSIPIRVTEHERVWRYIPQIEKWIIVGQWFNGKFREYGSVTFPQLPGEVGINLSFLKASRLLLESNSEFMLWLEDDTKLAPDFAQELERLLESNLPDFDFIYLGDHPFTSNISSHNYIENELLLLPYAYWQSHCVLVSRKGAEKFITYMQKFGSCLPLDWILWNIQSEITREMSFNSYFVNPEKICIAPWKEDYLDSTQSDIREPQKELDIPRWFPTIASNFAHVPKSPIAGERVGIRALQIGVFSGDATEWLLRHRTIDEIHDVDTWQGSAENDGLDFESIETYYDSRIAGSTIVKKFKMTSNEFFAQNTHNWTDNDAYDFIYIDGDHTATQTAIDCLNAFQLLKVEGVMAMDDYRWNLPQDPFLEPKIGIDAFLQVIKGRFEILEQGYQVWIRRTR